MHRHLGDLVLLLGPALVLSTGCGLHRRLSQNALAPSPWFQVIPMDYGLAPEAMWVATDGAVIHTWFFHAVEPRATVVVCNGNTGNKEVFLPIVPRLVAIGYEVVLFDYRGFGLSTGQTDLYKLVGDTEKVVDAVHARAPDRPLVLFGTSLGSAIATLVARDRATTVNALVLESTFSPRQECRNIVGKFTGTFVCPTLVPSNLEVSRQLKRIEQPFLMLHGSADKMTPVATAAEMYHDASARGGVREFWLAAGAGHSPGLIAKYGSVYLQHISRFLDASLTRPAVPSPQASWAYVQQPNKAKDPTGKEAKRGNSHRRGVVEVRFAAETSRRDAPTPVEVSVVYASGKTATYRRWLEPDREPVLTVAVDERPLLLTAVPAQVEVEPDGDGWIETDLRAAGRIEIVERRLKEVLKTELDPLYLLVYGQPRSLSRSEYVWEPFQAGNADKKAAGVARLLEIVPDARAGAEGAVTDADRARGASALARLAAALELFDRADEAYDLYHGSMARMPEHPETVVLYGDASWSVGVDRTIELVLHRLVALARTPEERMAWIVRLGEREQSTLERRAMLARWRNDQATASLAQEAEELRARRD